MAETLTPLPPSNLKQRTPLSAHLRSPFTSPFLLGSNDDQLERAQARAARSAATRRKSFTATATNAVPPRPSLACLNREQIIELYRNCVKLASENKINEKNTWELKLIDHLSEIIKVDTEDNNANTNFQKVSCTLEAGVKIYAARVDAFHADAYRVLSRICRAGHEDEQESLDGGDRVSKEKDVDKVTKETERKVSPLSTVESSFEAFNVKKFDGGAKGLLMCNLGVYGQCRVLFDSEEVPGKGITPLNDSISHAVIDLSFAGECIELLKATVNQKQDISPTLEDIKKQLDGLPSSMADDIDSSVNGNGIDMNKVGVNMDDEAFSRSGTEDDLGVHSNGDACNDTGACPPGHYDDTTVSDDGLHTGDPTMEDYNEDQNQSISFDHGVCDSFENGASLFCGRQENTSANNAWAGPDHWKYQKPNESTSTQDSGLDCAASRPRNKKNLESDIDFTSYLDVEEPQIFVHVKHPKSLLLPVKKEPCSNKLPEDCHYQPEDLVKLFLLPNIMCLGKQRCNASGFHSSEKRNNDNVEGPLPSWDSESTVGCHFNDAYNHSDAQEDVLVSQPHLVGRTEVEYDKFSKHVDVQMLKETLWTSMQGSLQTSEMKTHKDVVSFRHLLATFPGDCKAAGSTQEISPHLCFICLLHLSNELGLTIEGCSDLDEVIIYLPLTSADSGQTSA